jgi:hypothetical protein
MNLAYENIPKEEIELKTEELIKQADAVMVASPVPATPPVLPVRPQGQLATMLIRNKEDLVKVPKEFLRLVSDKDGNPLPEWIQCANLMNRPHKKVAIVGFADTRDQAPFDDLTWEIWGLNDLHTMLKRYDRWFDIHPRDNIEQDTNLMRNRGQTPPENIGLSGLRKLNVPVYMQDRFEDIPNSMKFPLAEVTSAFPMGKYMTNSISYMIALAILEGFEEISVYGVDMAVGTEYVNQRPSCEYWIGVAAGRGIKIYIPDASDLCKTRFMYGFEAEKQNAFNNKTRVMRGSMQERHRNIAAQEQQAHDARMQYEGAIGALNEIDKIWSNLDDKI